MDPDLLSLDEVLLQCDRLGLEVSERTFRYYAVLGLLPRPIKRPSGDARVHFYHADILERLKQIRNLQAEGHSLKQVKKLLLDRSPEAATPAFLQALAQGSWQEACQRYLDSSGQSDAALRFLHDLLSFQGLALEALSAQDLEACLGQFSEWHQRQKLQRSGAGFSDRFRATWPNGAEALESLLRRVDAVETEGLPLLGRAQSRLAATLRQLASGQAGPVERCDPLLAELEGFLFGYRALLNSDPG